MQETQEAWFHPWVRKIPWRRARPPTPLFLPGESHGRRRLAGCSPRGRTQLRQLATHAHTHASGRKWGLTRARLGPALNSTQSSPKINADNCNKAGASLPEIPAFRSAWTRAPTGRTRLGGEVTPAPSSFHFPDSATQRKVRSA